VAQVDDRIRSLVADMLETMYDASGVGLAATQVNVHERVVVLDTSEERNEPLVYWLQPSGKAEQEQVPALKLPDGFYTLSLRMMKAVW
jgi:peptide deformylase